ncbi:MAG: tail fiber protein [Ignisphaera sp.]|nr:tail fiber protein [Ignisphaera sp.]
MSYTKTVWVDGQAPAIDSVNLNKIEDGIFNAHGQIEDIIDGTITVPKATMATTATALVGGVPPPLLIGAIFMWAGPSVPFNYLECNGQTLPRTHALFSILGTTYGVGDGITTFNIPDFRGQFIRGWDHGRGVDVGRTLGSYQDDDLKSHRHNIAAPIGTSAGNIAVPKDSSGQNRTYGMTTDPVGGVETRPKNIAIMYIIKAV